MHWVVRALVLLLVLAAAPGCRPFETGPKGRSPLLPLVASAETIALEVFSAPSPVSDPQLDALWAQVDEQPLPAELRRKLAENGLRAGIVGPSVPDTLAELLNVTDRRIDAEERSLVPIQPEPGVTLTVMQPRSGERRDLVTSQTYDEIALLRRVDGRALGKTYYKAEGRFVLRTFHESDGRVRLELSPELHHGEFKNRVTGSDGIMTWKQERQKEPFDELKLTATLAPGQMLLITCRPDRPGTVGHWFFTQTGGEKTVQKLYVLRAAQASPDRSFYEGPRAEAEAVSSDARQ